MIIYSYHLISFTSLKTASFFCVFVCLFFDIHTFLKQGCFKIIIRMIPAGSCNTKVWSNNNNFKIENSLWSGCFWSNKCSLVTFSLVTCGLQLVKLGWTLKCINCLSLQYVVNLLGHLWVMHSSSFPCSILFSFQSFPSGTHRHVCPSHLWSILLSALSPNCESGALRWSRTRLRACSPLNQSNRCD